MRIWLLTGWAALVAALVPLVLWGVLLGYKSVSDGNHFVTTFNASVSGDLVVVASVNAGRVVRVRPVTGATVREGDALADVELPAPVRLTSGGTPVLAFLGTSDQQVQINAPVDGTVASILVAEGSAVIAGQPIMRIVDPVHLRITAYVTESDLLLVRTGQEAEVYFTALNRKTMGVVQSVAPATASAFTVTPIASTQAPTTTPVYPVYIRVDVQDTPQLLGSSAEVRIRYK